MTFDKNRAFTLIEVILAIALIAMFATIIATFMVQDEDSLKRRPPERILMSAIKSARLSALETGRETALRFDKRGFFVIFDYEDAEDLKRLYLNPARERAEALAQKEHREFDDSKYPNNTKINFYALYPEVISSSIMSFSEEPLRCLRFSPDGVMNRVNVVLESGGKELYFESDPFTGALIEKDRL